VPVGRFFLQPIVHATLLIPPPNSLSTTLPLPGPIHTVDSKFSLVQTIGQMDFSEIAVGGQHVCAIGAGGASYCWGSDFFGQVGNGNRQEVACGFGGPTLVACVPNPTLISSDPNHRFTHIGAGAAHNCGLALSGKIFCWGTDGAGELGVTMPCPSGPCFARHRPSRSLRHRLRTLLKMLPAQTAAHVRSTMARSFAGASWEAVLRR
jgi:Regulator of chromosome condensation (RCC1) repeat